MATSFKLVARKAFGALLLLAATGAWFWGYRAPEREIADLPAAERQALFARTFETLRTVCNDSAGPNLTNYCEEQASFLVRFPECDPGCAKLAHGFAGRPTR